jgi:hypothetical protein
MPIKFAGIRIHADVVAGIQFYYCHPVTFCYENPLPGGSSIRAFDQVTRSEMRFYATILRAFATMSSFAFESFPSN